MAVSQLIFESAEHERCSPSLLAQPFSVSESTSLDFITRVSDDKNNLDSALLPLEVSLPNDYKVLKQVTAGSPRILKIVFQNKDIASNVLIVCGLLHHYKKSVDYLWHSNADHSTTLPVYKCTLLQDKIITNECLPSLGSEV